MMLPMILMLLFWRIPAQAGYVTEIAPYLIKSKTFYQDITRDGKPDKIRLKVITDEAYGESVEKVKVYVNGKNAGTIQYEAYSNCGIKVYYIYMSQNREFLQICEASGNDYVGTNELYSYQASTGKLKKVCTFPREAMNIRNVVSASSSRIQVLVTGQPTETGWIQGELTYVYKNGKFQLKSNVLPVKSLFYKNGDISSDQYAAYLNRNQYVVANKRAFYTTTGMKKKAFTAKRGDVLTLKKMKISGKKVYLQFQKGSKTGWQRVFRNNVYDYSISDWDEIAKTGWFYGIYQRLAG